LTAAHAAALSKELRCHFRVIPASAWDDEQMEIGEYLAKYQLTAPLAIPYLWITDEEGQPRRAVCTRELVNLCRDRSRAWEIFAELAGVHETAAQQTDRTQYEKARQEGAAHAIQLMLTMLAEPLALQD
jgi:pyruvate-ferredoxin/flavodoxin oxidoreductase